MHVCVCVCARLSVHMCVHTGHLCVYVHVHARIPDALHVLTEQAATYTHQKHAHVWGWRLCWVVVCEIIILHTSYLLLFSVTGINIWLAVLSVAFIALLYTVMVSETGAVIYPHFVLMSLLDKFASFYFAA